LLVFALSSIVSSNETCLVDSGSSFHITGAKELFDNFIETGSDLSVELGMGTKHALRGSGIVWF
jgi:hypothetical protein